MANKKTIAVTNEQFDRIIEVTREGFIHEGKFIKPNQRIATILVTQGNLGMRIGDILNLRLKDIIRTGKGYKLDVIEEKTQKTREFFVRPELYNFLVDYCLENGIRPTSKIFNITSRSVQRHLTKVTNYLKYNKISTHSFRKYFAESLYKQNNDILLVQKALNHSSVAVTQRYLGVSEEEVNKALDKHLRIR